MCEILKRNGIDVGFEDERELFIDVYRFLATRHTLNSVDWSDFAHDSMFQLVFPQPGMIRREVVEAYSAAASREERQRIAADYMRETNPHDGKQQLNKPWLATAGATPIPSTWRKRAAAGSSTSTGWSASTSPTTWRP